MQEITVRLQTDDGLERLLEGEWTCLVWLERDSDGAYTMHAGGVPDVNPLGEAYLRLAFDSAFAALPAGDPDWERRPPVAKRPPSEAVANAMERLRIRLGWSGNGAPE